MAQLGCILTSLGGRSSGLASENLGSLVNLNPRAKRIGLEEFPTIGAL